MRSMSCLFAAVVGLSATTLSAQPPVPVGARVMVSLPEQAAQRAEPFRKRQLIRGELSAYSGDTLFIRPAPFTGTLPVPLRSATSLYVSRGVSSRVVNSARYAVAGAALGAAALLVMDNSNDRSAEHRTAVGGLGAFSGFVGFGIFGLLTTPVERWRVVPLARP